MFNDNYTHEKKNVSAVLLGYYKKWQHGIQVIQRTEMEFLPTDTATPA